MEYASDYRKKDGSLTTEGLRELGLEVIESLEENLLLRSSEES